jgi:hypothetical protein
MTKYRLLPAHSSDEYSPRLPIPVVGEVVTVFGSQLVIYQGACAPAGSLKICESVHLWSDSPKEAAERFVAGWVDRLTELFPTEAKS